MDPLSHVLFGGTLHGLAHRPLRTGTLGAFLLGSVAPDIDTVLYIPGFDTYFRYHDTGTHSILGTAACALVVAGLVHWWRRRPTRPSLLGLFVAAWLGGLGHILWDLADGADLRLLAPFLPVRVGWHVVAMADPFVLALLLAAALVGLWQPAWRRRSAVAVLVVLTGLLAMKRAGQLQALDMYRQQVRASVEALRVEPVWGTLTGWRVYTRSSAHASAWVIDTAPPRVVLLYSKALPPDTGIVALSRRMPVVRNFLELSTMPFPRVERVGSKEQVLWSELQYCSEDGRACPVSFGAVFDGDSKPLYQVLTFGALTRVRPVPAEW